MKKVTFRACICGMLGLVLVTGMGLANPIDLQRPAAALPTQGGFKFKRSVFLNGVDVSSTRNQTLLDVNIRIDEKGDVYIEAPHYQVSEESSYTPLSSYVQGVNMPEHAQPSAGQVPSNLPSAPFAGVPTNVDPMHEKAGSKKIALPNTVDPVDSGANVDSMIEPPSPYDGSSAVDGN